MCNSPLPPLQISTYCKFTDLFEENRKVAELIVIQMNFQVGIYLLWHHFGALYKSSFGIWHCQFPEIMLHGEPSYCQLLRCWYGKGSYWISLTVTVNHSPAVWESQSIVLNRHICCQFYELQVMSHSLVFSIVTCVGKCFCQNYCFKDTITNSFLFNKYRIHKQFYIFTI